MNTKADSTTPWRSAALCAMSIAATSAAAATITDIAIVNRSSADFVAQTRLAATPIQNREFHTEATVPTGATVDDAEASFTTRMAWVSTNHVYGIAPDPLPGFQNNVAYDVTFAVEDPTSSGYLLSFESVLRGYLTAKWTQTFGTTNPSLVAARGTHMEARLDAGNGQVEATALDTPFPAVALATNAAPSFENRLVSDTGTYDAGTFFGTRGFVLSFAPTGALVPNTEAAVAFFNLGEAAVRFGLNPTLFPYSQSLTPNGADGELPDALGHFVTVNVTTLTPVPEPGIGTLLAAGLATLMVIVRRKVSRS
jgi:hypothetical protein